MNRSTQFPRPQHHYSSRRKASNNQLRARHREQRRSSPLGWCSAASRVIFSGCQAVRVDGASRPQRGLDLTTAEFVNAARQKTRGLRDRGLMTEDASAAGQSRIVLIPAASGAWRRRSFVVIVIDSMSTVDESTRLRHLCPTFPISSGPARGMGRHERPPQADNCIAVASGRIR